MTSTNRPIDLSDRIEAWLRATLSMAEAFALSEIVEELKKLSTRQQMPGFQLAFVGEFSRGKSTLINRLLAEPLLPVGDLPTTATITSLVAGSMQGMEVFFADGQHDSRPLEESSWDDLIADDQPEQAEKVIARVRLTVDNAWLRELDAEMIDTPGINDLSNYRAALVSETLSESDAAVLLVSAIFPLSLTEAAFLQQQVLGRHIPQVIVVVSMLDKVPASQQGAAFKAACERVGHVSSLIQVYPAHPLTEGTTEADILEAVRLRIADMVAQSDRRAWRSQQAAATLVGYLGQLIEASHTAIEAAQLDSAARLEASRKAQERLQTAELQWEKLGQDFEERRLQLDTLLREQLLAAQNTLVEAATDDLNKAPDPKIWWERDFPLRLRNTFFTLAHDYENRVLTALARDVQWLQQEVTRQFGIRSGMSAPLPDRPAEIPVDARSLELTDIERQKLFVRLGTSAAALVGYLLLAPIGGALSVAKAMTDLFNVGGAVLGSEAVNIAASPWFNRKTEAQRKLLSGEISRTVERGMQEYTLRLSIRLRDLYSQVIQDMKREQTSWLGARKQALLSAGPVSPALPWTQLLDEASQLQAEILAKS